MTAKSYVKVNKDGSIQIFGNKDGMPEITGVIPAPGVNTKDEKERQKRHEEACEDLSLLGYFIVSKKLIRNESFDDPGQRTTLQVVYRPCKTRAEIRKVAAELERIVLKRIGEQETVYKQNIIRDNPEFLEID